MVYRKRRGVAWDTWHFCANCSNWPTMNYIERQDRPKDNELCNECKGKDKAGMCSRRG